MIQSFEERTIVVVSLQTPTAGEDGLPHRESCSGFSSLKTARWRHLPAYRWQRWRAGCGGGEGEEPRSNTKHLSDFPLPLSVFAFAH